MLHLRRAVIRALPLLLLATTAVQSAEIDVHLSTTLPQVRAVQIDAIPTSKGPTASLSLKQPTDLKTAGGERVDGLFSPFSSKISGVFRYFVRVFLYDEDGEELKQAGDDDDDGDDSTPIVDIFIDTDCEDCGDYDFTVPVPPGGMPTRITGRLELLDDGGNARWHVTTSGNSTVRPAAYAEIELLDSKDPGAPLVLVPRVKVPLDKTTLEFSDDLIFKDGEPANLNYQLYTSWLDAKGAKIGQTEIFAANAEVARKRKDGTIVYRPWRFSSDLSEVVGESWTVDAMTDTYLDASAFQYTLTPTDGGPKFEPATRTIKQVSQYQQKGQARDVTIASPLEAGQTWTFQARLLGAKGEQVGPTSYVSGEAIMDDGQGLVVIANDTCNSEPINCIPGLRIRYSDKEEETNPFAVWVTSTRFVASSLATSLELIQIAGKGTGPLLTQYGQKPGYLLLPVDTSRVVFESDLSLVFPSGTPDKSFTYQATTGFLGLKGDLLGPAESSTLTLKPKGGGWTWVAITHDSTIKIK